ncbi:MAG: IS1 family transposase [Chroococcidiopsidaceae cyanobacterium CP_BM_RX_35]|nr:IS1 family transposase [Chroococcidiopsidaceae cyanobacterium CP_BM_RX_35]
MLANAINPQIIADKLAFLMTTILAFLLYSFVLLLSKLIQESIELSQRICEEPSERACPTCGSEHLIKNSSVHNGKPKCQCKSCGHEFVVNLTKTTVPQEIKQLIYQLLLERISLRGTARVTQVSWSWLQDYVNQKLAQTPHQLRVLGEMLGKLIIKCDKLWSFVSRKKNEVYIWLSIDRKSRKIIGCFVGDRTRKSARKLWASLPETYQQYAFAYTDFWQAYKTVISHNRHPCCC